MSNTVLSGRHNVSGLLAAFLFAGLAFAQSTGTIQGTVMDASGAAVPNAPITIHNQGTGEERSTTTDSAGIYVVPSLPVGIYSVTVKAQGMSPMTVASLPLLCAARVHSPSTRPAPARTASTS